MKARYAVLLKRQSRKVQLDDWASLCFGEAVEIVKNAQIVARGLVEDVSPGGGVLWVLSGGLEAQYLKSEGVFVRRA